MTVSCLSYCLSFDAFALYAHLRRVAWPATIL